MSFDPSPAKSFHELNLSPFIVQRLAAIGYNAPSMIQELAIPHILAGRDVLGQAQTGTGKTAAFALPLLCRLDVQQRHPQVLVLVPTRELAIQVAEAFQKYAVGLQGFRVVPIYGGQGYESQTKALKSGVHIVVGTPGRVIDHIKRKLLDLSALKCFVLDEADEMLRMGFIDDVEWILEHLPRQHQMLFFSATMPAPIRKIADRYLKNPQRVAVQARTATVENTSQYFRTVPSGQKMDALVRILAGETFDGMLIFARTKAATVTLASQLEARGYACAAINGDLAQNKRERTIALFKSHKINLLVATDVAARGLNVPRISHVVNYDMPPDAETYIHRIGRTGRAGRPGKAILFMTPAETHLLAGIEKATNQKITPLELPAAELVNKQRAETFKQRITTTLASRTHQAFRPLLEEYQAEHHTPLIELATALAALAQPAPVGCGVDNQVTALPTRNRRNKK